MIKGFIYIITLFLSIYSIEGLNLEKFILRNGTTQIKILIILLSLSISYCVTNFIFDFLEVTSFM